MLHLEGDSIGVHLVRAGCILEHVAGVAACGCKQDARLDQHPRQSAFISAAEKGSKRFRYASLVALLPDAMLPGQHLDAVLIHDADQLLKDEEQVALEETNRDSGTDGSENTEAGRVGDSLFLALLFLFCLPVLIVAAGCLLGMMHRTGWIRAHLMDGANVAAFGDDGLGNELARLVFRPLGLLFILRLLLLNGGVLVTRQYRAAFLLPTVGGAYLH